MHEEAGAPRLFVVHAAEDRYFVEGFLLPALALPEGAVLQSTKLELGAPIVGEITRGAVSPVTVVVVSPHLLASPWAQFASELAAHHRVTAEERARVVPALLADCEQPLWLAQLVALEFRTGDREHWEAEAGKLRALLAAEAPEEREVACPYPGMRAFAEKEAALFFGREQEVEELLGRLRNGVREIYVIGPSGSGKSSLVVAGLVPALRRAPELAGGRFLVRTLRPGAEPVAALAGALEGAEEEPKGQGWAKAAVERLLARRADGDRLLLVVDQLEELFTPAARGERAAFEKALGELRQEAQVAVVLTLRADFYGALMESTLWGEQQGPSRLEVVPLRGEKLQEAIEKPAREQGVFFEPVLVERLLQEVEQEPGPLPLLQDLLLVLWHRRIRCLVRLAEYKAMSENGQSGLAITLRRRADAAVDELSPRRREIASRVLLRLVQFGEDGVSTRRQQQRAALAMAHESAEEIDAVIGHLADERLVTTSGGGEGEPEARIDLAHEALLKAWPRLAEWIQSRSEDEQRRRVLEGKAAEWVTAGRGTARVLDADELREQRGWLSDDKARALGVSEDALALLARSEAEQAAQAAREAAQKRRLRRWKAAALGVLIVALGVASTLAVRAQRSSDEAKRQLARNHVELGHALLRDGHAAKAVPYFVAAREAGLDNKELRMLFRWASRGVPLHRLEHEGRVTAVAWSEGGLLATASLGVVRVWEASSGKSLPPLLKHAGKVTAVAWSKEGLLVTASDDGSARVWEVASGKWKPLIGLTGKVGAVAWSSDGKHVVTASVDGMAQVWDAASGAKLLPPLQYNDAAAVALSTDGSRLAIVSNDGTARVWDIASRAEVTPKPPTYGAMVIAMALSPDGKRAAMASSDGTVRVWEVATGKEVTRPLEHRKLVTAVAWSRDGLLATASVDGMARVWDTATGSEVTPPLAHLGTINAVAWSPDGKHVLTGSVDGTARVWDVAPPLALTHEYVREVAWSGDGRLATANMHGDTRVWDVARGIELTSKPLTHSRSEVTALSWGPDGARLATVSADGTARVWDVARETEVTPKMLKMLTRNDAFTTVAWSRDWQHVAAISRNGRVRVWKVASEAAVELPILKGEVKALAWSLDGTRVAITSKDGTSQVWNTATGNNETFRLKQTTDVTVAKWSPDVARVATVSKDGTTQILDAAGGSPVTLHYKLMVKALAWSHDGSRVATATGNWTAQVWDAKTGDTVTPWLLHGEEVIAVAWSPDEQPLLVATASVDRTARVWSATTGRAVSPPLNHSRVVWMVVWSPDGCRLATVGDDGARVWDVSEDAGGLADWRSIRDRSDYRLDNKGVLVLRERSAP